MKASLIFPKTPYLDHFLDRQSKRDFSYTEVGQTHSDQKQAGYDNDHHQIELGTGEMVWQKAKTALKAWQQYPPSWTNIYPNNAPLKSGTNVAVLFNVLGIWWTNSARVVYDFDEENRFGFAYGTLPGHVEMGEEVFWLERNEQGVVTYHIKAFSKPAYWFVRLAYPLARAFQRRFCQQSMHRMKALTNEAI